MSDSKLTELNELIQIADDDLLYIVDDSEAPKTSKKIKIINLLNKVYLALDLVDNVPDLDKPVSTATQAALDALQLLLQDNLDTHVNDFNNPHNVTKAQTGLSEADNTSDADKPVSTAQQAAIDAVAAGSEANLNAHINDFTNPHNVNKAQVGLGNADNTADLDKPVSTATAAAIASAVSTAINNLIDGAPVTLDTLAEIANSIANDDDFATTITTSLANHVGDFNNPHNVNKNQVGLGNVDNTSDLNKPISIATQSALDLKYNASNPNAYETPAQLNSRDTANRARANHTGLQSLITISEVPSLASLAGNQYLYLKTNAAGNAYEYFLEYDVANGFTSPLATNLNTFQQALRLDVNIPVSGDYRIGVSYTWSYNATDNNFSARVQVDDTNTIFEHFQEPQDSGGPGVVAQLIEGGAINTGTDQRHPVTSFIVIPLSAGPHTIDLDIASQFGADIAALYQGSLSCKREKNG